LGAVLNSFGKFVAGLSLSTAFCYAWHYIFRTELQHKNLTLFNAFEGDANEENDFRFGVFMILLDTLIYAAIGYVYQSYSSGKINFFKLLECT
jgi:hypothetical protein